MAQYAKTRHRPVWRITLEAFSWFLITAGRVSSEQIVLGIVLTNQVTTNSMCSAAGTMIVLLIGSLTNSVAKE